MAGELTASDVRAACPGCGAPLRADDRFCSRCGRAVASASLQIPLGTPGVAEDRRHVTVLFADITGSTTLAERLDPEVLRGILGSFFAAMAREIHRHGGTIDKYAGDAVMAVFGAPVAHEDDPMRAIVTAVEMLAAVGTLNEELRRERGVELGLRIGINTGEVVAGPLAGGVQAAYTVVGDAVNTAQRLESMARAGEIVVGPVTYRIASRHFAFRALGPVTVKGKSEPLQAYAYAGAGPAGVAEPDRRQVSAPLVGRDAELATLLARIEEVALGPRASGAAAPNGGAEGVRREKRSAGSEQGRGGIVAVLGEPGIGKSRLVAEARVRAALRDLTWLEGRSLSITQTISYYPFLEIVRRFADITEDDDDAAAWPKLDAAVRPLFPEGSEEVVPYLGVLLALRESEKSVERVRHLDAEAMHRRIFLAARRTFAQLARVRPLVLVFEDWQWADASSVALVEHLLPLVASERILVVVVARPEPDASGARIFGLAGRELADRFSEIALGALTPEATVALAQGLLAASDLPQRLSELVLARSEGNPFFVEEVIRSLIDLGAAVRDGATGRWRLTERVDEVHIPDTLQGLLMARIDRLEHDVKEVLRLAAVIGRTFFYRVLREIARAAEDLDHDLGELQGRDLVRVKARIPELEYVFKHALAQEVTYESILVERRRQLHRQVGATIESLFADRLADFYGILAYHFARAEDWPKAQEYLFKAGDQAGRIAADDEAIVHYREAADAYARAFGDAWDPLARAELDRKIGEALFRKGEHDKALRHLRDALASLGRPYPATRGAVRRAIAREVVRHAGHRLLPWVFLRRPRELPKAVETWRIYETIGWIDYSQDVERVLLDGLTALNFAEETGLRAETARGLTGLGIISDAIGWFGLARRYHAAALALADWTLDPLAIGLAHLGAALHDDHIGRWEDGIAHCERSAAAFGQVGELRGWGSARGLVARLTHLRGDLARSLEVGREVAKAGEDGADRQLWAVGLYAQGANFLRIGDLEVAVALLEKAIALFRAIPDHRLATGASEYLGMAHLRRGDLGRALEVFREAERQVAEMDLRGVVWTRTGIAEAQLLVAEQASGRDPAGGDARANALREARRRCRAALKQGEVVREGLAGARRLAGTLEWLEGRRSRAERWWERSLAAAREVGARYDVAMTELEIGRRTGSREHLARAQAHFSELGAHLDAAQAERAIASAGSGSGSLP